ncbi:MAG: prepilin-type N-terminal cleavage/methylation domain-containing protein [Candidatus Binatia bacterium]|jgi:prepilin-type N-terminal cleavage/methylation domain-containing protein
MKIFRIVRRKRASRDQRGFTIVETMVAIGIMAVAFLGMASVHAISARAQSLGQNEGLARFVADQQLELMRRTAVGAIQSYTGSTTVQGVNFGITRTVSNVTMGKKVVVTTTWTDRFGPRSLTLTTIVSQVTNPS